MTQPSLRIEYRRLDDLAPARRNPKAHDTSGTVDSMRRHGFVAPVIVDDTTDTLVAGHGRLDALRTLRDAGDPPPQRVLVDADGMWLVPTVQGAGWDTDTEREAYLVADNQLVMAPGWDMPALATILADQRDHGSLAGIGFDLPAVDALVAQWGTPLPTDDPQPQRTQALADRFLVPPFSVLDARQGWWRDRKRAWLAIGLQSELGRGEHVAPTLAQGMTAKRGPDGSLVYEQLGPKRAGGPRPGGGGGGAWIGRTADGGAPYDPKYASKGGRLTFVKGNRDDLDDTSARILAAGSGTSIFDPVLCELVYRWFCPPGGRVLDPFAGGSVRGIVAARLGRSYLGVDLRAEQVEANRAQADDLLADRAAAPDDDRPTVTPIERVGDYFVKRDDAYSIGGSRGGKVRTCWELATAQPVAGLVTAGSRHSPQVNIVAGVARALGVPCRVHVPAGDPTPELVMAEAQGAEVVRHRPGYNTVLVKRAHDDAAERGWLEIPFGMECPQAVHLNAAAVAAVAFPADVRRLVIPVGSGMTLAGVMHGLRINGPDVPVVGVVVGADPTARLDRWAPEGWRDMVTLVPAGVPYEHHVRASLGDVPLDPVYEAKCLPFMEPDDLLWVVGRRATHAAGHGDARWVQGDAHHVLAPGRDDVGGGYDLVFTCPPYADLERYSDDPDDLSTMPYDQFREVYAEILARAVARLGMNRYAVVVVGEARGPDGHYYGLVPDTINAMARAGCRLYNEAILVTPLGSLPVRAGRQFAAGRKLGKTHQNVLVFVKGDGRAASDACGIIDVSDAVDAVAVTVEDMGE